MILVDCELST